MCNCEDYPCCGHTVDQYDPEYAESEMIAEMQWEARSLFDDDEDDSEIDDEQAAILADVERDYYPDAHLDE